jgi:hypothetical protein
VSDSASHWIRTIGAPTPGDPRDGELHECLGKLRVHFDLEPWDESSDDDVRYFRSDVPPVVDEQGRTVWIYEYRPTDAD